MASEINVAGDIASYVNTIYEDALLVLRDNLLATSVVRNYSDRSGTATRSLEEYGTVTINQVGDADDLASQSFKPSNLSTITPLEYGAQFLLSDLRTETDPFSVRSDAAMELGMGMAESIDTAIFGNMSSLTGGTVGASGSAISWGYFFSMMSRLRAQKVPRPWVFVCHPYQWDVLAKAASVASSSRTNAPEYLMEEVARNFFVQNSSGVDIFISTNVQTSGTDAYAMMINPMAIAYDQRRAPRLEAERDASRRAWELNFTAVYGHGVWRPKFGIQGIFDNTAPTT